MGRRKLKEMERENRDRLGRASETDGGKKKKKIHEQLKI